MIEGLAQRALGDSSMGEQTADLLFAHYQVLDRKGLVFQVLVHRAKDKERGDY